MQIISGKPLRPIWLKAAVVGSIWASVEIILGSFLHNLRIPFTGMLMSLAGVWILIAFLQIWKEKGLIWRAGLICALMKSISPSAIILGPMIGIFTEALLVELFTFLLGRNLIGFAVGGALAVTSTLIQKILSLLITYGLDLIKIADGLYRFAVKQIGMENLSLSSLLIIITAIYIATGITGALLGYLSGKKYLSKNQADQAGNRISLQQGKNLFSQQSGHNYSVILLIVNILTITGILVLFNFELVLPAIIVSSLYLVFCIFQYRNSLKRLKKFSFWITFLLITFAATFLWDGVSKGVFFSNEGLMTGVKMNLRAIIMVIGFASISVELRNPVIKSVLYNRGFANLYQALNLSFSALPYIISTISSKGNKKISESVRQSHGVFHQAEELYNIFEKEDRRRPTVVIITGELHQGKTTFALKVVGKLLEKNISITGFLAIAKNRDGKRCGFDLMEVGKSGTIELCSDKPDEKRQSFGKYYFNPEAIDTGKSLLSPENLSGKQAAVVDEIGPLELRGEGWSSAIDGICQSSGILQIWVVRKGIIDAVLKKWNAGKAFIFDIATDTEDEAVNLIMTLVSGKPFTA